MFSLICFAKDRDVKANAKAKSFIPPQSFILL